jgi:hypothetical protein
VVCVIVSGTFRKFALSAQGIYALRMIIKIYVDYSLTKLESLVFVMGTSCVLFEVGSGVSYVS